MNPNKALWEKGDFTRVAAAMRASGEALVESLSVRPGMQVLDLGCGDGTTALPEARRGADVLGVDIARNLVAAGNRRAAEAGLSNCRFQEGDASNLDGIADDRFDLVVSIFGAMFAPRISAAYSPPPPEGFVSPMTWGMEANVQERFGAAGVPGENVDCTRATYLFDFAGPPKAYVDVMRHYYGPTMNAFEAAQANGKAEAMLAELVSLFERQNTKPGSGSTVIPATFLKVTVTVH
jgi:SAM-dependent methyltransferase